jgi:hypothetical protein
MNSLSRLTDNRYKITLEESWAYERPEIRNPDRIWYELIPCRGGAFISAYSLNPLIFKLWTSRPKNSKAVWEAVKDVPGVWADFHFDGEAEIYFPLEVLPVVAELAGAKRRRRLSDDHKAKLAEVGRAHRFKPKDYGSNGAENGADLDVLARSLSLGFMT